MIATEYGLFPALSWFSLIWTNRWFELAGSKWEFAIKRGSL
jgi:hypothetical protein